MNKVPDLPNFKEDHHFDIRTNRTLLRFSCNYSKNNPNKIHVVGIVSVINNPIQQLVDKHREKAKRALWRVIGAM